MRRRTVDQGDLLIPQDDAVQRIVVRGAMHEIHIVALLKHCFPDFFHKSRLSNAWASFDADDPISLPLSEYVLIIRKKTFRRVVAGVHMSFCSSHIHLPFLNISYHDMREWVVR